MAADDPRFDERGFLRDNRWLYQVTAEQHLRTSTQSIPERVRQRSGGAIRGDAWTAGHAAIPRHRIRSSRPQHADARDGLAQGDHQEPADGAAWPRFLL